MSELIGARCGEQLLILRYRCGHIPVALLGGATARVGDPSGKSTERPVLEDATIAKNSDGIQAVLAKILEVLAHNFLEFLKCSLALENVIFQVSGCSMSSYLGVC